MSSVNAQSNILKTVGSFLIIGGAAALFFGTAALLSARNFQFPRELGWLKGMVKPLEDQAFGVVLAVGAGGVVIGSLMINDARSALKAQEQAKQKVKHEALMKSQTYEQPEA